MMLVQKLVQAPTTLERLAMAGDFLVLDGKFVIVRDLLVLANAILGVDDNLLVPVHRDNFGVAVGLKNTHTHTHTNNGGVSDNLH